MLEIKKIIIEYKNGKRQEIWVGGEEDESI
jgi:hypothetical protein